MRCWMASLRVASWALEIQRHFLLGRGLETSPPKFPGRTIFRGSESPKRAALKMRKAGETVCPWAGLQGPTTVSERKGPPFLPKTSERMGSSDWLEGSDQSGLGDGDLRAARTAHCRVCISVQAIPDCPTRPSSIVDDRKRNRPGRQRQAGRLGFGWAAEFDGSKRGRRDRPDTKGRGRELELLPS